MQARLTSKIVLVTHLMPLLDKARGDELPEVPKTYDPCNLRHPPGMGERFLFLERMRFVESSQVESL